MIEAEHLTKHFGHKTAVRDISFSVQTGENMILLGTSGCGKTTTLRMINRLIEPDSGVVKVNGKNVQQQNTETLRRSIGYVLQHNSLFPHYTVAENIAVVPKLLGWDKKKINNRIHELLEKLQLQPRNFLQSYPHELSGGQQQRVNIARAMAAQPQILLMDEPFGALDTITRAGIRQEFNSLEELKNTTIVMVTHDVPEAFELGDRICLMNEGEIKQCGTPEELLFRPANEFVRSFLEANKLQLTFGAVALDDILSSIPEADQPDTSNIITVDARTTVWQAMDLLHGPNAAANTVLAVCVPNGLARYISWQQLLQAFNNYKPVSDGR